MMWWNTTCMHYLSKPFLFEKVGLARLSKPFLFEKVGLARETV